MRDIRSFIIGMLVLLMLGTSWDASFEASPADTDPANTLGQAHRTGRAEVSNRAQVEMKFGSLETVTEDNGLMLPGSARCFASDSAPTDLANVGSYDGTSNIGTGLSTTEAGGSEDQGKGRCWIDVDGPDGVDGTPDDGSLARYDETGDGFVYLGAVDGTAALEDQRFFFYPGRNVVFNGSFESTVGDGSFASAVPIGWADVDGSPTYSYTFANDSNDTGVSVEVTGVGSVSGMRATIDVKPSTTYFVTARVKSSGVTNTCRLRASSAGNSMPDQDTSSTSYTTLSGVVTSSGVADLFVDAITVVDTGVCTWDSIGAYELSSNYRRAPLPRLISYESTSDSGTGCGMTGCSVVSVSVRPPGPNYLYKITGWVQIESSVDNECIISIGTSGKMHSNTIAADERKTWYIHQTSTEPLTGQAAFSIRLTAVGGTNCVLSSEGTGDAHGIHVLLMDAG